jgi:hypothetical protein
MKSVKSISVIILLVILAGCGGGNKQTTVIRSNDGLITVDVTRSYPKKELILQDFMDVEYIQLEDIDEFLTQGNVQAVGKEIIVVINSARNGDIFIFDRTTGKGLRKINRMGQGGEEYSRITGIVLDEENDEIFVYETKIFVYDLHGNFKRSIRYSNDPFRFLFYSRIYNYDQEHLICFDSSVEFIEERKKMSYHAIMSKQDGSRIREISIPFKEKIPTTIEFQFGEMTRVIGPDNISWMIPYQGNWILTQPSADTMYVYLPDDTMFPFIARTPSIQTMETPEVFLFLQIFTGSYYFMKTEKREVKSPDDSSFPTTNLVYDIQEQKIYESVVYNDDFSTKTTVNMSQQRRIDDDIAFWIRYEAYELVEAYEKGELKGRLKEIAAELNDESNPVIMLAKHKN